ncbi:NAD-dependent epimerase/dehydratase family protein [Acinetobacter sp. NPDC052428]|uniref:NAD-dependent epimerase/dehydratase family protein n=1 Tax=Acinetobacter sp. NPDC052428 TaxID=3363890 RepID=UPI0037CC5490
MNVLITGSSGFLGRYLAQFLAEKGYSTLAHTRTAQTFAHPKISNINFDLKANFKSMMSLASKKLPLPIGCLDNKRSMVSVYNLADLIHTCMTHPNANGEVFLASDQDDISVKQLFEKLAKYQNNQLLMLPIPKSLIGLLASLVGKKAVASRLCSELIVDTTKNTQLLGWTAPYSVDASLQKMFNTSHKN